MRRAMLVFALMCTGLATALVGHCQNDKPWNHSGTKAGEEIIGPDGGTMVWVPPGEFNMGSNDEEDDQKPVHRVRITHGFWFGKCEVTNTQYRRYCGETGRAFPEVSNQGDAHPVVSVAFDDVVAYCKHYGLRLPTEAEWEYAARGPESRKYPWGNDWDKAKCCNWDNRGQGDKTYPVGSFPQGVSWCGAMDMAGNVWQWCASWYGPYDGALAVDPQGPNDGAVRVVRGGSWSRVVTHCRSAYRDWVPPFYSLDYLGFRCVVSPE